MARIADAGIYVILSSGIMHRVRLLGVDVLEPDQTYLDTKLRTRYGTCCWGYSDEPCFLSAG